ncbi:MAG: hypothetical protein ACYTEQ_18955, partial [Planctomycetota bacterium]
DRNTRIDIFKSFTKFIDFDPTQDDTGTVDRVHMQETIKRLWFGPLPPTSDTLTCWFVQRPTLYPEIVLDVSSIAVARPRVGELVTGSTSTATGYIVWYNAADAQIGLERVTGTFTGGAGETLTGGTSGFTATSIDNSADELITQSTLPENLERQALANYAARNILLEKGLANKIMQRVETGLIDAYSALQREFGPADGEPEFINESGAYTIDGRATRWPGLR